MAFPVLSVEEKNIHPRIVQNRKMSIMPVFSAQAQKQDAEQTGGKPQYFVSAK